METNNTTVPTSAPAVHSASHRGKLFALLCLLYAALPSLPQSQTLDDFRTAASSSNVDLIPFPDLRRDSGAIAAEVERRKIEVRSLNFGTFKARKNNMLEKINEAKAKIEKKNNEIADFKRQHPDGFVTPFEDEIKEQRQIIDDYENKIKDLNKDIAKAADVFDRLNNARAGLREYFDKALRQLAEARSNPSRHLGSSPSADDIKRLEGYINVIEDQINSQVKEHQVQEKGAKDTKEEYEALMNKTEL